MIRLFDHQQKALHELKNGSILCGGVGSGKSLTSIAYYVKSGGGDYNFYNDDSFKPMDKTRDLYIITTAKKRDSLDWDKELGYYTLSRTPEACGYNVKVVVDSWNNIKKYTEVRDAFFIFDEQRLVGSGAWVKSFLKIAAFNEWILLSATPGDVWKDYIPVFIANGFYRNKTDFARKHIVYKRFTKYQDIDYYIGTARLERLRDELLVHMPFERKTKSIYKNIKVDYDKTNFKTVMRSRWDIYNDKPIKDMSNLFYIVRRVVNSDPSRVEAIRELLKDHPKLIIFYNFDYELEALRELKDVVEVSEWNGHNHQPVPESDNWVYLVQYNAGAEGWNCITTNALVFYSLNYSHKIVAQAAGRIDRLNTPFKDLFYFNLISDSPIDWAIRRKLREKKTFHERSFYKELTVA